MKCKECGREFQHTMTLNRHIRHHEKVSLVIIVISHSIVLKLNLQIKQTKIKITLHLKVKTILRLFHVVKIQGGPK